MKRARRDILSLLIILAVGVGCALPFFSGEKVLYPKHPATNDPWGVLAPDWVREEPANRVSSDKHSILHPDHVHTRRELEAGHVPLWNPHNYVGLPHQANPITAVFYPFNAMFLPADLLWSYGIKAALHIFLAALFGYFFLRTVNVRPAASLFGALGYALGGWMIVHHHASVLVHAYIWLPLALASVEHVLRSRARWALLLLSLSIGCMFLAGFPQTALNNAVLITIYTGVAIIRSGMARGLEFALGRMGFLLGFGILGITLAMVQLSPTFDFMRFAGHQDRTMEDLRYDSLRPIALLTTVMPDFFGSPHDLHQPNIFEYWLLRNPEDPVQTRSNYNERSIFPGLIALALFLVTPFFRRDRVAMTLWISGIVAVFLATGSPLLDIVAKIPVFTVGSPMRWLQLTAFAMPMLSAMVLDRMLLRAETKRPRAFRIAVVSMVVALLPLVLVLTVLWVAKDWALPHYTEIFKNLGAPKAFDLEHLSDIELQKLSYIPMLQLRMNLTLLFAACLGLVALITAYFHPRTGARWVYAIALVFVVAELGYYGARYNRPMRSEGFFTTPAPGVDYLRENLGDESFIRLRKEDTGIFFSSNTAQIFGLNDSQAFRALSPQTYLEFMRTVEPNPWDVGFLNIDDPKSLDFPQIDLIRVKYAIARKEVEGVNWKKVYPPESHEGPVDMVIYENPDEIPPVGYIVHEVEVAPPEKMLAAFSQMGPLKAGEQNPFTKKVFLNELRQGMQSRYDTPTVADQVDLVESRSGRFVFDCDAKSGGILVVTQQFMSGWKAWRLNEEGKRVEALPVLPANHFLLGIPVKAEKSRIEVIYDPSSFRWGGLISGLSLAFLLLVPLLPPFRPRDEELLPVVIPAEPDDLRDSRVPRTDHRPDAADAGATEGGQD